MDEAKIAKFGTKAEVFNKSAQMTRGKLTIDDLTLNPRGKVVSKKAQARGYSLQKELQGRISSPVVEELPKAKELTASTVKKVKKASKVKPKIQPEAQVV